MTWGQSASTFNLRYGFVAVAAHAQPIFALTLALSCRVARSASAAMKAPENVEDLLRRRKIGDHTRGGDTFILN